MSAVPAPKPAPARPAPSAVRLPPHDLEVEAALLGEILYHHDLAVALSEDLRPDDFFLETHEWVYQACLDLHRDGQAINTLTVAQVLRERDQLQQLQRGVWTQAVVLEQLIETAINGMEADTLRSYCRIVKGKAARRRMLLQASELARMAYDETLALDIQLSRHERAIAALRPYDFTQEFTFGSKAHSAYLDQLRHDAQQQNWFPVPWRALGERIPCILAGDLIGILGPEGSGKSALLLNMAVFYADLARTCYIYTEMNRKAVFDRRAVAANKRIIGERLDKPETLTDEDWAALNSDQVLEAWSPNLDFWHAGRVDESRFFSVCQRLHDDFDTKIFVVDYVNDIIPAVEGREGLTNAWRNFLSKCEAFNNGNGTIMITAAQMNDAGGAYMIGKAFHQKAMIYLELKPDELQTEYSFSYDSLDYRYHPGDFSPHVDVKIRKYRKGGRGTVPLFFVGPRYLWIDVPPHLGGGASLDLKGYDHD